MSHRQRSVRFADQWPDTGTANIYSRTPSGLRSRRPNRWRGTPSRWRALTLGDRLVAEALDKERNRNLSLHLYCTFKLKQRLARERARRRRLRKLGKLKATPLDQKPWQVSRWWTAWPLPVDKIPPVGSVEEVDDDGDYEDYDDEGDLEEQSTSAKRTIFRRVDVGDDRAAKPLEEAIIAAILRFAKKRFRKRKSLYENRGPSGDGDTASSCNGNDGGDDKWEDSDSLEDDEVEDRNVAGSKAEYDEDRDSVSSGSSEGGLPTVATDDDLSAELLLPGVRTIIQKVDRTLTIMHNAREAARDEPRAEFSSGNSSGSDTVRPGGQDREQSPSASSDLCASKPGVPDSGEVSDGRVFPPIYAQQSRQCSRARAGESSNDGEQDDQQDDQQETGAAMSETAKEPEAGPATPRKPAIKKEVTTPQASRQRQQGDDNNPPSTPVIRPDLSNQAGLLASSPEASAFIDDTSHDQQPPSHPSGGRPRIQTWKDVLGAAAIAGFDSDVLARAAQRCADLFDDSVVLNTVETNPPPTRRPDSRRPVFHPVQPAKRWTQVVYAPRRGNSKKDHAGDADNYVPDVNIAEEDALPPRLLRALDRPSAEVFWKGFLERRQGVRVSQDGGEDSGDEQGSQSQSKDVSSTGDDSAEIETLYYCPFRACDRAIRGFRRKYHLLRHSGLVHGYTLGPSAEVATEPPTPLEDERDENGLRVDGFLQPIRLRDEFRGPLVFSRDTVSSTDNTNSDDNEDEDEDDNGEEESDE